jgi:hypothetical protein
MKATLKRYAREYLWSATKQVLSAVEDPKHRMTFAERLQFQIQQEIFLLKETISRETPDNPVLSGFKVYSQVDEDGIIQELFRRVPSDKLDRTVIEIGCGDGLENNTHFLILKGYRGFWIDASDRNIAYLRKDLGLIDGIRGRLKAVQHFVEVENTTNIIAQACDFIGSKEPDLLSIDIDGNDLFILQKALMVCRPKFLCVEYNAKFPPRLAITIKYNEKYRWEGDDYHGVSLQLLCDTLPDYTLVTCNISGANAFFVRNDMREPFACYPIEKLYQPLRVHLRFLSSGHYPSLKWLNDALDADALVEANPGLPHQAKQPALSDGDI